MQVQGLLPHSLRGFLLMVTSIPTICGDSTFDLGQKVWVNNMAPMEGLNGQIVNCMPGVITRFHKAPDGWLVEVQQLGSVVLPIIGDPFRCFFRHNQIS